MNRFVLDFLKHVLVYLVLAATLTAVFDRKNMPWGYGGPELTENDKREITLTVELFNKVLSDFYATGGDPALIDDMPASKNIKHFIYRDIGFIGRNGMILVLDQASSRVTSLRQDKDIVLATFFEEWNYVYQKFDTRKPVSGIKGMGLSYTYALSRKDNGWQIDSWGFEDVPAPSRKEEFLY